MWYVISLKCLIVLSFSLQSYRQSLKDQYELLKKTVALGNSIITLVIENTPAYRYIDTVVCSTTQRWEEIVTLLGTTEEELSHVLITWQACDFEWMD